SGILRLGVVGSEEPQLQIEAMVEPLAHELLHEDVPGRGRLEIAVLRLGNVESEDGVHLEEPLAVLDDLLSTHVVTVPHVGPELGHLQTDPLQGLEEAGLVAGEAVEPLPLAALGMVRKDQSDLQSMMPVADREVAVLVVCFSIDVVDVPALVREGGGYV